MRLHSTYREMTTSSFDVTIVGAVCSSAVMSLPVNHLWLWTRCEEDCGATSGLDGAVSPDSPAEDAP